MLTLILSVLLPLCSWADESETSSDQASSISEICQTDCATPYGQVLSVASGNVHCLLQL